MADEPGGEPPAEEPKYDEAFFLDLAAKGKDAWNAWRRDPANKDARVTFAGIDFSEAPTEGVDFSGFEFGDRADFSGCTWRGGRIKPLTIQEYPKDAARRRARVGAAFADAAFGDRANFRGAAFGEGPNFVNAAFGDGATFDGAAFDYGARFDGAAFGKEASFARAAFGGIGANFVNAAFGDRASFVNAAFGDRANFTGAAFGRGATFVGAAFGDGANFTGAAFGDGAEFTGAAFGSSADFVGAAFGDRASIGGAAFGDRASFAHAAFGDGASFHNTRFKGHVQFTGKSKEQWSRAIKLNVDEADEKVKEARIALKKRHEDSWTRLGSGPDRFLEISFGRARFDGEAVFSRRTFEGDADFTNARFYRPPDFDAAASAARIDFSGVHIGYVPSGRLLHWTSESKVPVRLRRLRKLAEDTKNHDLERDLYILSSS